MVWGLEAPWAEDEDDGELEVDEDGAAVAVVVPTVVDRVLVTGVKTMVTLWVLK